jgi:hypothetical protein
VSGTGGPYAFRLEIGLVLTMEDGVVPLEIEHYDDIAGPDIRFLVVELDVYRPASGGTTTFDTTLAIAESHLSRSHLALDEDPGGSGGSGPPIDQTTAKLLASDLGYRTLDTDAGGIVPYPPILNQAFQVDNKVNLDPGNSAVGAAWGTIILSNADNQFDAIAASYNSDGRSVRLLTGIKPFDPDRQYHRDPPYDSLAFMWSGVATPWFLSDTALTVPVRDATYWLERPYQTSTYGGTGGYEGTPTLTGKPKPRARGGLSNNPIRNITPTLVDPTNRIYQYNDGRGRVLAVLEGGAAVITFDSDTTNLYAGTTPAGKYRTDNSRGLFQLGSVPVHTITANVTGQFPVAGTITTFAALARYILTEDLLLPPELIDLSSFTIVDGTWPFAAGVYFDSNSSLTGVDVVAAVLSGTGAKLISKRNGELGLFMLRAVNPGAMARFALNLTNIVQITPIALPNTLDPPPYRFRVVYDHNYTQQTSDLNIASSFPEWIQFIAMTGNVVAWASTAVLAAYRRPNDPAELSCPLLAQADAQAVANDLGALWGVRRRLYDISMPAFNSIGLDIGDIVSVTYPMDDLGPGRLGQIVGYSFKAPDVSVIMRVLV